MPTRGASSRDTVWNAAESSARDCFQPVAEDALVRGLPSQIETLDAQRRELGSSIVCEFAGDETYACLPAIPGIGPKTATTLVAMIDVSLFVGEGRLASYCGLAPANRQSGTSVSCVSASRSGNKTPVSLLIFNCNSLSGSRNRFGRYYDECRASGMAHNKALKAVARKKLSVQFVAMFDKVPYTESGTDCSKPSAQAKWVSQQNKDVPPKALKNYKDALQPNLGMVGMPQPKAVRNQIGFPDFVMHDFTHTKATQLLGNGVDVEFILHRRGHAKVSLMLNMNDHAIPINDREAAAIVGDLTGTTDHHKAEVIFIEEYEART